MSQIYHTDMADVSRYVDALLYETNLELSKPQRLVVEEVFSSMNEETLMHSLNCVKFANEYIQRYNESGNSFESDFKISEQDFMLGMAIHDVGKTKIAKEILEYDGKYNEEQRNIINMHADPNNGLSIIALNECLDRVNAREKTSYSLREAGFSTDATDISIYHHAKRLNCPGMKDYIAAAAIVDVSEAASANRKYFQATIQPNYNEDEAKKEALKNAVNWAKGDTEAFFKSARKENDTESHRILGILNDFVHDVTNNNSRFFQDAFGQEHENFVAMENIKNLEKDLNLEQDMDIQF